MDNYTATLDSETEMYCTLYLYTNVQNCNEIREKIMNGEVECSIIKAALIVDPLQIIVAANKAAVSAKMNQLTTKNLYTEILFNLSMSKNITRALTEFGIHDKDKNILVALMHKKSEEKSMADMIKDTINGERISISNLSQFTDIKLLKKTYKIKDDELDVSSLINSIVSRISCKDFILMK